MNQINYWCQPMYLKIQFITLFYYYCNYSISHNKIVEIKATKNNTRKNNSDVYYLIIWWSMSWLIEWLKELFPLILAILFKNYPYEAAVHAILNYIFERKPMNIECIYMVSLLISYYCKVPRFYFGPRLYKTITVAVAAAESKSKAQSAITLIGNNKSL